MSEYDDIDKTRRNEDAPEHSTEPARFSPWLWVIPAVAIFFVGYLIVRYGFFGGGDITVKFAEARGLERYSPVRFRGAKVGTVQKIAVDEDGKSVIVRISMDASMKYALTKGTKFWIVEPGLETGGIGSLLSGTYVGISPGQGDETREFTGQEYAPILSANEPGKTLILEARGLGGLSIGSPVQYQGMRVGRVLGAQYDQTSGMTMIHVHVVQRFADQVKQSTRFWRGGGLNVSLGGGGVSVAGASLSSLMTAPVSFYTPELFGGAPVRDGTHFELYDSQAAAEAAADGPQLTYLTYFTGPVKGLVPGTPVTMRGVQVGRVREVRLRYIPQTASLETPVTIEIDPRRLEMPVSSASTREDLRVMMNDALAKLVNKGMRASLATSLVLPGASGVSLDLTAKPGTGQLVLANDPPIIPAATAGSGLEGALGAINDIAGRIRALPIEEIAGNLRSTSERLNTIVHDPALDDSLRRMNAALVDVQKTAAMVRENAGPIVSDVRSATASAQRSAKNVEDITNTAKANVDPIVASLRNAASSAEAAAGRAQQLMGSSARQNYDLGELIKELTRAAEAVRALATYINENPDTLIKGRPK